MECRATKSTSSFLKYLFIILDGRERKSKELELTKDVELGDNFDKNEDDSDSSDSDSEEGSNKALIFEKEKNGGKNTSTLPKKGTAKQRKGRKMGKGKMGKMAMMM